MCRVKIMVIVTDTHSVILKKMVPDLLEKVRTGKNAKKPDIEYVNKPQILESVEKETKECAEVAKNRVQSGLQEALASASSEPQKQQIEEYYSQWGSAFERLKLRPEDFTSLALMPTAYISHAYDAVEQPEKKAWNTLVLATMTSEYFCTKKLPKLRQKDSEYRFISRLSPSFDVLPEDIAAIENGNLRIGMSKCAAMAVWGDPTKMKNQTDKGGVLEQWIYGDNKNIYFQNGVITSFTK